MKSSFYYSLALHLFIIIIFFIQLPFFKKTPTNEMVVVVDLVKVGPETNLKNSNKAETSRPPKKSQIPPSKPAEKDVIKIDKKSKTKTEDKKKEEKPQPKKEKKTKNTIDEIDSLLKDLDGSTGFNNSTDKSKDKNSSSKLYDSSAPLSISEKDNIKAQIEKKFTNPIAMNFKPGELLIKLRLNMNEDGTIKNVEVLNSSIYSTKYGNIFITLKNSLVRAAYIASPIRNLPADKYHGSDGWQEIELSFDAYFLMNG
jgi:outer membrane biosynthesis protein TonB